MDFIQQKPSHTPAEKIPHFVQLQAEADSAAEDAHSSRPTMQAPGSLGARRERTPLLVRNEKETHLRNSAAN